MLNLFSVLMLVVGLFFSTQISAQTKIPCTCRFQGMDYGLGEEICVRRSAGSTMARCEMVLNNTSWKFTNIPCPVTKLHPSENSNPTEVVEQSYQTLQTEISIQ